MADNGKIQNETTEDLHLHTQHETGVRWPFIAGDIVRQHAIEHLGVDPDTEFYVVWFSFTLGNWKALVSSTASDGRYYEITHRVNSGRVFVDTYLKTHNTPINVNF